MIFYLMGKSASGKDHIFKEIMKDPSLSGRLEPMVIYTTRPMRKGEKDGREYYFTDARALQQFRDQGKVIEERCYDTVEGPWYYFTADDGRLDPDGHNYLGIGTLESYEKLLGYFGQKRMVPILIETDDGIRLERALRREKKQEKPQYKEMCRRFLADSEDFSEEKIRHAGITRRFENNGELEDCIREVAAYIRNMLK
ncbi:MAG: guanylate kinase [Eubacteriales bacterium]|jgi:guanylate kinase